MGQDNLLLCNKYICIYAFMFMFMYMFKQGLWVTWTNGKWEMDMEFGVYGNWNSNWEFAVQEDEP